MISLLSYAAIAFMGVLIMPRWCNLPYTLPRQTFIVIAAFLLSAAWLLDPRLPLDPILFVPLAAFWLFRSITSKRPEISFETMLPFISCIVLGAFLAGPEHRAEGLSMICAAGTLNAVYAIAQRIFKVNLFKFIEENWNPFAACGFTRSTTVVGPYLVAVFFLTLYLTDHVSLWFVAPMAIQLFAIYLTENRASFVALLGGLIFLFFQTDSEGVRDLALILVGSITLAFLPWSKRLFAADRMQSALERKNFLKIFWFSFKKKPILGMGFNVLKTHVPYIQRELNQRSHGKFLDPKNYNAPVMRKVHHDLFQHILDVGILGTAITVGTIWVGINRIEPYSAATFVSILVAGLFYTQAYWLPTQCLFWLSFGMLSQGSYQTLEPNLLIAACWFAAVGYVAWTFVVKLQIFDMLVYKIKRDGFNEGRVVRAISKGIDSSVFLFDVATQFTHPNKAYDATVTLFRKAIERYDGELTIWSLFSNLANAYFYAGSPMLCKIYHEVALSFYPYHPQSLEGLKMIDGLLAQAREAQNGRHDNGGKRKDDKHGVLGQKGTTRGGMPVSQRSMPESPKHGGKNSGHRTQTG